jgi:hypothetical protein
MFSAMFKDPGTCRRFPGDGGWAAPVAKGLDLHCFCVSSPSDEALTLTTLLIGRANLRLARHVAYGDDNYEGEVC